MKSDKIKMISTGQKHSLIYLKGGELYGYGNTDQGNFYFYYIILFYYFIFFFCFFFFIIIGQIGFEPTEESLEKPKLIMKQKIKMVCCGQYFSIIYLKNGNLMGFGANGSKLISNFNFKLLIIILTFIFIYFYFYLFCFIFILFFYLFYFLKLF